jgi:hypothetical protein
MPIVRLRVSTEMDPHFTDAALSLLNAEAVNKIPDSSGYGFIYRLDIPDAPVDAVEMSPVFARDSDGATSVQSFGWMRAGGTAI